MQWILYAGEDLTHLSPVEVRQLRLLRYGQWVVGLVASLFLLMAIKQQVPERIVGLSLAECMSAWGIWLATQSRTRTLAVHTSLVGAWAAVMVATQTNGGLGSVASAWILYLPLVAGVMGGLSIARIWVYVILCSFFVLWAAEAFGLEAPNLTAPAFQYWQDRLQQLIQGTAVVLSLMGLIGQVQLSEKSMLTTIDALELEVQARLKAEQAALQAEQKKTAFFTSMSHELRTPLNAISGFTQLLIKQANGAGVDERGKDALQRVLRNGQGMLALVNNLLSMAKLQDPAQILREETYDLHQQIAAVLGDISSLKASDVALVNQCSEPLMLHTDREVMRRILANLLTNALKFTLVGNVVITTSTAERDGKTWLAVTISDTGPGIPDENLPYLFEPYTRGVGTVSASGTGLGLALSQQWAKLLGGNIDVSTHAGRGSVFTLYMPIRCVR